MLDDFAIHVANVKAAVGRIGELDRAKPKIGGGQELHLLLVGRTFRDQLDAAPADFFPVNQIAPDIGDERVAEIFRRPRVAAINGDARRRGEIAGRAPAAFDGAGDQAALAGSDRL